MRQIWWKMVEACMAGALCLLGQLALAEAEFVPAMPRDMGKVDVYLLTVGRGSQPWALFGHSILRVIDHSTGADLNFNWGIFDFNDPAFVWKFYRGDLRYMMAISDYRSLIELYQQIEHRRVVQDRINLTNQQKFRLMTRLIENARPENLYYQYSQLRDNCSTRLRDHLDVALNGKLQQYFQARPSAKTMRYFIDRDTRPLWWVFLGLDLSSNSFLDREINEWTAMFLPESMRELLSILPALDDAGNAIAGRSLLSEPRLVVDEPEPPAGENPYWGVALLFGVPSVALSWLGLLSRQRHPARGHQVYRILYGLFAAAFGTWSALWGTVFLSNWMVSAHIETHHNALLMLFWPIDWLFVWYGVALLKGRRWLPYQIRTVRWLGVFHLVAAAMLAMAWAIGLVRQAVLPGLVVSALPGGLFFALLLAYDDELGERG